MTFRGNSSADLLSPLLGECIEQISYRTLSVTGKHSAEFARLGRFAELAPLRHPHNLSQAASSVQLVFSSCSSEKFCC